MAMGIAARHLDMKASDIRVPLEGLPLSTAIPPAERERYYTAMEYLYHATVADGLSGVGIRNRLLGDPAAPDALKERIRN
jgi:hypothetical protein